MSVPDVKFCAIFRSHWLLDGRQFGSKAFEKILNSGELFRSLSADEAARLEAVTVAALKEMKPVEYDFTLATPNGPVRLHMKNDYVKDRNSKVEYICVFREISD